MGKIIGDIMINQIAPIKSNVALGPLFELEYLVTLNSERSITIPVVFLTF